MEAPGEFAVAELLLFGDGFRGAEFRRPSREKAAVVVLLRGASALDADALVDKEKEGSFDRDGPLPSFEFQAAFRAFPTAYIQPSAFAVMRDRRVEFQIDALPVPDLSVDP